MFSSLVFKVLIYMSFEYIKALVECYTEVLFYNNNALAQIGRTWTQSAIEVAYARFNMLELQPNLTSL